MITLKVGGVPFSGTSNDWLELFNKVGKRDVDSTLLPYLADDGLTLYGEVEDENKRAAIIVYAYEAKGTTPMVIMDIEKKFGVKTKMSTCNNWRRAGKPGSKMRKTAITNKYKPMAAKYKG